MPAFTPNLNLYKPGGGSSGLIVPDEVVDIDRINANMDILDEEIGALQTKTSSLESSQGLIRVRPSSVTGVMSLQSNGTVFKAGMTNGRTNIDGVFKPEYDRYRITTSMVLKAAPTAGSDMVARINGVDYTGLNYYRQQLGLENTTNVNATTNAQNSFGGVVDGAGTLVEAVSEVLVGSSFLLISSQIVSRGGVVSTYLKTANVEALSSRPTGLGFDLGQSASSMSMSFYAYL